MAARYWRAKNGKTLGKRSARTPFFASKHRGVFAGASSHYYAKRYNSHGTHRFINLNEPVSPYPVFVSLSVGHGSGHCCAVFAASRIANRKDGSKFLRTSSRSGECTSSQGAAGRSYPESRRPSLPRSARHATERAYL